MVGKDPNYDPSERRARYLRERELKGRQKGSKPPPRTARDAMAARDQKHGKAGAGENWNKGRPVAPKQPPGGKPKGDRGFSAPKDTPAQAKARVSRLQGKISTLQEALTKTLAALAEARRNAAEEARKDSDGKTTVKERKDSKEYRDKHKEELKDKREKTEKSKSSSSSSGSSSSSSGSDSKPTVDELQARVSKIRGAITSAKKQLSDARAAAGQLAHSDNEVLVFLNSAPVSRKESVHMTADFGGFATRHDVQCADGRTILPGAFQENDGAVVPLVYGHDHNGIANVLGHCVLEYRPEGVYAHGYFNETPNGQLAKEQVKHGDLKFLSIFANNLQEKARAGLQHAKDVMKGNIREVSLVLAGANPGAFIDNLTIAHSDGSIEDGDEALIFMNVPIDSNDVVHADVETDDETIGDVVESMSEKQQNVLYYLVAQAAEGPSAKHDAMEHGDIGIGDDSIPDVVETMSEKQQNVLYYLVHQAMEEAGALTHSDTEGDVVEEDGEKNEDSEADEAVSGDEDSETTDTSGGDTDGAANTGGDTEGAATTDEAGEVQHDDTQEDNSMTHNLFAAAQQAGAARPQATLAHGNVSQEDAIKQIVKEAKKNGSLKDALENYIEHTGVNVGGQLQHGIENIDYLFPDAQLLENAPGFISRRMEWVDTVLSGVRKSPFSRIKTITADITPDEARARGYIKGNFKNEEFFALSKRTTDPQTIYKKQRLDRDDVIDIVNLDVVAWLKAEMKVMLDEEIAGAILVGDGRSIGDDDKILETHIRPIASDAELYVTTVNVNLDDASSGVEELVDAVIANRRYYKGSGQPTFFTTESTISSFLTVKDNFGRRLYANLNEVAAVLRVSAIVPVEVMERVPDLVGIMVNLADYTLGADRGGQATMFDDFDIDYNKLRYLIETRLSGALTQPKAAIVFRKVAGSAVLRVPAEPTFVDNVVTVPTVTGVTYKNADTDATLTTAAPVTLTEGQTLNVKAVPAAGSYFANSEDDEWSYTGQDLS